MLIGTQNRVIIMRNLLIQNKGGKEEYKEWANETKKMDKHNSKIVSLKETI